EGLVDNKPNYGFYIHVPTLREITELFMLRQSLEMIAAMYAAEHGTDRQFDELETLFSDFIGAEHIDKDQYFIADKEFHNRLVRMCNNRLMHKINESMQIMNRSFSVGLLRPPKETVVEHLNIVDALRSRNPDRAQDVTRAHTETTKRHLLNVNHQIRALGINSDTLPIRDAMERL
ncbi:MAG: GntR family transcriptional regulator, partial [Clostridia bacterium]|nr:GntR family transcriptional regulator [Clostridia bacterium]